MKKDHSLQRRPLFAPIWLPAVAALILLSFAAWLWRTANSTTIVVLRHAETRAGGADAPPDPPLGDAGAARAARLTALFGDPVAPGRIDAVYVTDSRRARQTVAPLAARLAIQPVTAAAGDPGALARRLLHENHGRRALLVVDADVEARVVAALSGTEDLAAIAPDDYGSVFVVTVPDLGRATLLRLRY